MLQFLLLYFITLAFSKYYILSPPNLPYSNCIINSKTTDFKGLDIIYAKSLMNEFYLSNSSIDYEFKCVNFSDISTFPAQEDILFAIGGITQANSAVLQGMKLSYPISFSGLSVLLYKEEESWIFFRQLGWDAILFIIIIPLMFSFLQFFFEEREFTLEDYLWNSYSALFLMNNLKLRRISSRIMQFSLWIMGFLIWTMSLAGYFSAFYQRNPIFHIKSTDDLNNKLVVADKAYLDIIRSYGAKPSPFSQNSFEISLDFYKSSFANSFDGIRIDAFVLEDSLTSYLVNLDQNFRRIAPKFVPISNYFLFPEGIDADLMKKINEIIVKINEKSRVFDVFNEKYFKSGVRNKIPMAFIEELLIFFGVSLSICAGLNLINRLFLKKTRLMNYLIEKKVINVQECRRINFNLSKKDQIFSGLEEIIENEAVKLNAELKLRLEIMRDKINKFYDCLLITNNKNNQQDNSDEKPFRRLKKQWTFPNFLQSFKRNSISPKKFN